MGTAIISHKAKNMIPIKCLLLAGLCQAVDQSLLDNIASSLDLRFDVLANHIGGCQIRLTFTNKGRCVISRDNWTIYFNSVRKITRSFTPDIKMTVMHIDGYLHKLTPTRYFQPLLPGKELKLDLSAENVIVSKTDVMPNWYVASLGLEPRIIHSTAGESMKFVGPFDTPSKWKLSEQDMYDPFTPEERFDNNKVRDIHMAGNPSLPTPLAFNVTSALQKVNLRCGNWKIIARESLVSEGRYLAGKLNIRVIKSSKSRKFIELQTGAVHIGNRKTENDEAYNLKIDPQKQVIRIVGNTPKGVFWGIQSLLSVLGNGEVSWVTIEDSPRYEYRGLSIDVARNFLPKREVMRILDGMATFKMNKLHLHLTDDEGWRLEIPGLLELTTIASQRCHDPQEKHCLEPQLGSGPFNNTSGSGYYSVEDYQEILKYANQRHIDIIPEFDLPGHSHAAITAMENRYRKYRDMGRTDDGLRFYLNDPKDKSFYESGQFFRNNSVNPCIETTYSFVEKLIFEVRAMHAEIQPLKVIHIGGDEVPQGAWALSPACQRLSIKINSPYQGWKAYFIKRVASIAGKYNVNLGLWEDGLLDGTFTPITRSELRSDVVYGYAWGNTMNLGYRLANAGYKVVMTQASHLYFDHPYEPDPEERGLYWATRYTDTRKSFGFMPEHLFDSLERDENGMPINDYCSTVGGCVTPNKLQNIVGMAGSIWSETIRTPSQFQSMIFPRLLAVAERAWHKDVWEDESDKLQRNRMRKASWEKFANTLGYKELARLDKLGINYRIPLPGARIVDRVLKTNVAFPGLKVECSIDGGQTWFEPKGTTVTSGTLLLRTRSADGKRTSRKTKVTLPKNDQCERCHNHFYFRQEYDGRM